jgi:hypothetical protein
VIIPLLTSRTVPERLGRGSVIPGRPMLTACSRAARYPSAKEFPVEARFELGVMLETITRMSAMMKRLNARITRIFLDEFDCN